MYELKSAQEFVADLRRDADAWGLTLSQRVYYLSRVRDYQERLVARAEDEQTRFYRRRFVGLVALIAICAVVAILGVML